MIHRSKGDSNNKFVVTGFAEFLLFALTRDVLFFSCFTTFFHIWPIATLRDPSVVEVMNFVTESQQCAVDKKLNSTIKASAARELSKFLNSPEPQQYFTSWSLDNVSDVGELKSDRGKYKKSISETTSGEDRRLGDTDHCFLRISHFTDTEPVTVFQMS